MIDLVDYLRGDGRLYELVNNWGSAEICQTQTDPNNVFYQVKNSQWEELWADDVFVYRGADTSSGNGELYLLSENNHYGSAWVPRWFDVGQTFQRTATVMWRVKSNGATIPSKPTGVAVTYLRFVELHNTLTFQSGIQLNDVAELQSFLDDGGKPAATPWEKYFYARGFGLVTFQDMLGGFTSWIAQKFTPQTMPPRVRESLPWLVPIQKRYYLPAAPKTTPTGAFELTKIPSDLVNVRAYPNGYGNDLGDLVVNDVVTLGTPEVDGWVMATKGALSGWVSRQNGAVIFTSTTQTPEPPPVTPPPPPPTTPPPLPKLTALGPYTVATIPSNWINVRDYPDETTGNDLGDLHIGDSVILFAPDVNGWVNVEAGTLRGWVSRQAGKVTFTAVLSSPSPTPAPLPHEDIPPLPNISAIGEYLVATIPSTYVNVRAYPADDGTDVGDLHVNDVVTLFTPEVSGWVFVQSGNTHGWVSRQNGKVTFTPAPVAAESVIPHDVLSDLPQVSPEGEFMVSHIPTPSVDVRAYPNQTGADVGNLHQGDVVTLYTPDVDDWMLVEIGDMRGWVWLQNGAVSFTPYVAAPQTAESASNGKPHSNGKNGSNGKNNNGKNGSNGQHLAAEAKEDAAHIGTAVGAGVRRLRTQLGSLIGPKGGHT